MSMVVSELIIFLILAMPAAALGKGIKDYHKSAERLGEDGAESSPRNFASPVTAGLGGCLSILLPSILIALAVIVIVIIASVR